MFTFSGKLLRGDALNTDANVCLVVLFPRVFQFSRYSSAKVSRTQIARSSGAKHFLMKLLRWYFDDKKQKHLTCYRCSDIQ